MDYLLICRPPHGVDVASAFPPHLAAERQALVALREGGQLVAAYSPGGPGAVLHVRAPDAAAAQRIADDLPLARAGAIDVELIELHPMTF